MREFHTLYELRMAAGVKTTALARHLGLSAPSIATLDRKPLVALCSLSHSSARGRALARMIEGMRQIVAAAEDFAATGETSDAAASE